ncbi:MAG: hypothetical protein JRE47_12070 [Deltaproteobacteria bacterium]|nr:hypothetical protein [Deltaproteobacteria bacterium]
MKSLSSLFIDDFKTIENHLENILCMVRNGDDEKIVSFPREPLLEKALDAESFKIYMFDSEQRLVIFIPEMPFEILSTKLLDFESRFSITEKEKIEGMHEFIMTRRMQLATLKDTCADIEDVFSIYIFSNNLLIRDFDIFSNCAVVFALIFGTMNHLNYDDYDFDYSLSL